MTMIPSLKNIVNIAGDVYNSTGHTAVAVEFGI